MSQNYIVTFVPCFNITEIFLDPFNIALNVSILCHMNGNLSTLVCDMSNMSIN